MNILLIAITSLLIFYISVYFLRRKSKSSTYTVIDSWALYWLRWSRWVVSVWLHQTQRDSRLNNYRVKTRDYRYCGLSPTPHEEQLERPVPLTTERHEDTVNIWGADAAGRAVYARITRLSGNRTSVIFIVRDGDGSLYTLPNQPDSIVHHVAEGRWCGAGLLLECVQPMRTWRLKFNGYLRKGPRSDYSTNLTPEDDGALVEARLDLVWRALRAPIDLFRESDPRLLASALAREPDADLRYFTSLDRDAYDQQGSLSGTVCLNSSEVSDITGTIEDMGTSYYWYLRGGRQRRWGMSEAATKLHRSVEFMNFFGNGDSLYHYTFCYPTSITQGSFGYVQTSGGAYRPFTRSNFDMGAVGEDGSIPSHVFLSCTGNFKSHEALFTLNKGSVKCFSGDPWTLRHDIVFGDAYFGANKGITVAVFTRSYSGLCPVPELFSGSLFNEALPQESTEDYHNTSLHDLVLSIDDSQARDATLTGGKGSSLAYLSALDTLHTPEQVRVPSGVIVTTAAWRQQLQSSQGLFAALSGLKRAVGSAQEKQMKDASTKAGDLFLKEPVCELVKNALLKALEDKYKDRLPQIRFAVRSSGSDEDSDEASAAGQNLTMLGCRGVDSIIEALTKCWASLVTYSSVQYKRQRGLDPVGEMAVVVQEMVEAEVAGVIFTRHPTSGSPASITITANYGLGESVVSGSSEPDTLTVGRSWRDTLTLKSSALGDKKLKHILNEDCSTVEVDVSTEDRRQCCIQEPLALRLATVAVHVEKAFHSPRDIEFAVAKDKIYLLQARPITNLHSWTDLDLLTELDSPSPTDHEIITRANTGEVFPLPSTPLSLSTVVSSLNLATQRYIYNLATFRTYNYDPACHRTVVSNFLHACLSVIDLLLYFTDKEVTNEAISIDLGVFGHKITTQSYIDIAVGRNGLRNGLDTAGLLLQQLWRAMTANRLINQTKEQYQSYSISTTRALTADALYHEISLRLPDLANMSTIHADVSGSSSSTQTIAMLMLTEGATDISSANISDMAKMLAASCDGQESAGVPGALKNLAGVISKDEDVKEFFSMSTDEGSVWLNSHPGRVGEEFQNFIENHGHRCIQEFELGSSSWGMDCRSLVKTLQAMAASDKSESNTDKASNNVSEILDSLSSQIKPGTRRALEFILPVCRSSVQRRESAKSYLIKTVDAFRRAYKRLGELMVSEGRIPKSELLLFLQHYEIGQLLNTRSPELVSKAIKRSKLLAEVNKIQMPEISEGRFNPFQNEISTSNDQEKQKQGGIKGTPVSLGKATGPARVISSINDAENIKAGDILITYSTDIGWTPYFPLLSGVVTEIGGLLSHGAVVAREYGLPCIVGATDATKSFISGELVELNGTSGTLIKLKN